MVAGEVGGHGGHRRAWSGPRRRPRAIFVRTIYIDSSPPAGAVEFAEARRLVLGTGAIEANSKGLREGRETGGQPAPAFTTTLHAGFPRFP